MSPVLTQLHKGFLDRLINKRVYIRGVGGGKGGLITIEKTVSKWATAVFIAICLSDTGSYLLSNIVKNQFRFILN